MTAGSPSGVDWDNRPDAIELVNRLWCEGVSTPDIAAELTKYLRHPVSKSAICGKIGRLAKRNPAAWPARYFCSPRKDKAVKSPRMAPDQQPRVRRGHQTDVVAKTEPPPEVPALPPLPIATVIQFPVIPLPSEAAVMKLRCEAEPKDSRPSRACAWPKGEPGTKGFCFCEDPAIRGKPYCLEHTKIAYVQVRDRKEDIEPVVWRHWGSTSTKYIVGDDA